MAWFRKKSVESNIPPELQQYYQTENRQRMWLAWVVALISLVATISIVLGLFFGIRAFVRKGQDKDQNPSTAQVDQPQNTEEAKNDNPDAGTETNEQPGDVPETPAPSADEPAPTPPPASTPENQPAPAPAPSPGSSVTSVPNTGPADTAAIFLGVSAAGYAVSALRRKLS